MMMQRMLLALTLVVPGFVQAQVFIAPPIETVDARIKNQTPAPETEAAVRKSIGDLLKGQPDYDGMTPRIAEATRQELLSMQQFLQSFGELQSIIFKEVCPDGADLYQVNFAKGSIDYRILLDAQKKLQIGSFHPSSYPPTIIATADSLHAQLDQIDALLAQEFQKQPIGSVTAGVVLGKDLIWFKIYGEADMEKHVQADKDTVYRIGSITKMFTALMLEQMVEAGKIHLSDPVEKYVPEIRNVQGSFAGAAPITLLQLATHTSGLDREPDSWQAATVGPVKDWEKTLLTALPQLHFQFEPGTRFLYSNIGYAILGLALSRASGESYVDYIPRHIFAPLGMAHSSLDLNPQITIHLAKGYQVNGSGGRFDTEVSQRENLQGRGYKVPNGAVYTTIGDMARFTAFVLGQDPKSILRSSTLEHFQKEMVVASNPDLASGYGIGFQVFKRDNYAATGHGGEVIGYHSMLVMNRQKGIGVIVLSSGAVDPGGLALKALDILSK